MATHGSDPMPLPAESAAPGPPRSGTDAAEPGVATRHDDGPPCAAPPAVSADRYELLDEIARGGLGVVYRARDAALGREVAVKVLQDRFEPGSGIARRFLGEARIAAQLQHPGIPPVHDVGTLPDGRPFLAMKLIKGQTLDQLLRERPDPAADRGRFVAVFEQVCQALAFAHARRVIHRDLKPDNVMVGAFGEVQVMDWGLAKVLGPRAEAEPDGAATTVVRSPREHDGAETQAGSVLGTPPFMPPEQAAGAVDQADERSDVFGLGAILAMILTGQPPFVADTAEATRVIAAQGRVGDCFRRLDESGAEPDLVALCQRCLAPEQADRPRDAGAVAAAVAELRAAADERARRAEVDRARAEAEAREQRKRRRVQAALGAALLAAAALVVVTLWREDRRAAQARQEQAAARDRLAAALDRAAAAFQADRLADADAALDRAADLVESADAPDHRARYDDLRADRAAVAELDRVWARANALRDDRSPGRGRRPGGFWFDEDAARTGYPAAFAARGLAVGKAGDLAAVADRMSRSAIRDRLVAALDDWLPVAAADDRPWLCDLLARVDPDPARNEIRRGHVEPERLRTLFARPPAEGALRVAARAALADAVPDAEALAVLRAATVGHPTDFRTQYTAGVRAVRSDRPAAAGYFRAAAALRPDDLAAALGLGFALDLVGRPQEAAPHYLRAIEIDPKFVNAYINLADAIKRGADPTPAVVHFRRTIDRDPRSPLAHFGLSMALRDDPSQRAAAVAAFRQSVALDDRFALAHHYLGYMLDGPDEVEERVRCYRRAIELDPTFAFSHFNLANVLRARRDVPGAIAEYRKAIELFPEHTQSHLMLGDTLARQRDFQGAEKHLRRVLEINPNFLEAYPPLGRVLLAVGDATGAADVGRRCVQQFPTRPEGYDGLVQALGTMGAHTEAVRAYHEAVLRADATWPEAIVLQLRYNAACSAVLAAAGEGRDPPPPADRPPFRQQALTWLRADLDGYRKAVETGSPAGRAGALKAVKHWLDDADLASVRDPAAVAALPAAERDAWTRLWEDVRKLLAAPPAR